MARVKATVGHHHHATMYSGELDSVAVARAVAGDHPLPRLRPPEIREVVRVLIGQGMKTSEIARHIGACDTTVRRHRRAIEVTPIAGTSQA